MSDWACVVGPHTTFDELQVIIDRLTKALLDELAAQMRSDPEFTARDVARARAIARPMLEKQTRDVLTQKWLALAGPARAM